MKNKHHYFAEIVESSLAYWVGQSWQWNAYPTFGSMIAIDMLDKVFYAVVYDIKMGSSDPNRYPMTYQKTEQELLADYPHIFEFIKTNFYCLPIGYAQNGKNYHFLPVEPAKIHAFMRSMTDAEKKQFFCSVDFMPILFKTTLVADVDELMLALVRNLIEHDALSEERIHEFLENFSLMAGNDYRRLKIFAKRIGQFI